MKASTASKTARRTIATGRARAGGLRTGSARGTAGIDAVVRVANATAVMGSRWTGPGAGGSAIDARSGAELHADRTRGDARGSVAGDRSPCWLLARRARCRSAAIDALVADAPTVAQVRSGIALNGAITTGASGPAVRIRWTNGACHTARRGIVVCRASSAALVRTGHALEIARRP